MGKAFVRRGKEVPPDEPAKKADQLVGDRQPRQKTVKIEGKQLQLRRELDGLYKLYRRLYEYAPVSYFILEANDHSIIDANMAAIDLLRLKRSQLIDTQFTKYLSPDSAETFYLCTKKARESLNREKCEVKLFRKAGPVWLLVDLLALVDERKIYLTAAEITGQKEAEASIQNRLRDSLQNNRELSSKLLLMQEEERRKLAIDIHDNLAQSMTLLVMQLHQLRKVSSPEANPILEEIESQSEILVQQVRDLSSRLSMHRIRDFGLAKALQNYFEKVRRATSLNIDFRQRGLETRLSRVLEIAIFHIIQEAITNVLKHANTDEVDVSLDVTDSILRLRVEDRGDGFVPDSEKLNSPGMRGMRERAEVLGASWMVDSSPGKGTILNGEFPLVY